MTVTLTYDSTTARVLVAATGLAGPTATVERSTNQVQWTTVRAGIDRTVTAGVLDPLRDYEFTAGVTNYYRVGGQSANITPALDRIWLKSPTRPFLNRAVTVVGWSDVSRPGRGDVVDVVGRTFPVGLTEVRGSRRWSLDLYTATPADRQTLDYIVASGDVLFVHTPLGCEVPGGYVMVADTSERRPRPRATSRVFTLPVTEVAPPGPDLVYAEATWTTVLAGYATWSDVLAAFPTWGDLLSLVGDPSEVVVP